MLSPLYVDIRKGRETIAIAVSKVKHPYRWFKKLVSFPPRLHLNSNYPTSITSRRESSPSFVLSEAIESPISSENILRFQRPLFILTSEPKIVTELHQIQVNLGDGLINSSPTAYHPGSLKILKMGRRCIDTW